MPYPHKLKDRKTLGNQNITLEAGSKLSHQNENKKVQKRKMDIAEKENVEVKRLRRDESDLSSSDLGRAKITKLPKVNDQKDQGINIDKVKNQFAKSIAAGSDSSVFKKFLNT